MKHFETAVKEHLKSIAERDITAFSSFLHPSHKCIVILPNGDKIEGFENIVNFHKDWFEDPDWRMDAQIADIFTIDRIGYVLLDVVYRDMDENGSPYEMKYFLSLMFVQVDRSWFLLRDQNTLK